MLFKWQTYTKPNTFFFYLSDLVSSPALTIHHLGFHTVVVAQKEVSQSNLPSWRHLPWEKEFCIMCSQIWTSIWGDVFLVQELMTEKKQNSNGQSIHCRYSSYMWVLYKACYENMRKDKKIDMITDFKAWIHEDSCLNYSISYSDVLAIPPWK